MNKTPHLTLSLLALGCLHCAADGNDTTVSTTDPVQGTPQADAGAGAGGATAGEASDASTTPGGDQGGTGGESDAAAPAEVVTGDEPECTAAFTRIAECYLTQDRCVAAAQDNVDQLGPGLAATNCASFAMQAGGLAMLAEDYNAQTACDAAQITGLFDSLDMSALKELCESEPLDAAGCTESCNNIVPCKDQLGDEMTMMALGDKVNCEGNCTMQPSLSPLFRCATAAGSDCGMVAACFAP